MIVGKFVLVGAMAGLALCCGMIQSAQAARMKHGFAAPHPHYKVKKGDGPTGGNYLAPRKQRKPTGYYRSTLTGKMVYGKQK
jgi:hypothetical protein